MSLKRNVTVPVGKDTGAFAAWSAPWGLDIGVVFCRGAICAYPTMPAIGGHIGLAPTHHVRPSSWLNLRARKLRPRYSSESKRTAYRTAIPP